jgi:hypothetical protein
MHSLAGDELSEAGYVSTHSLAGDEISEAGAGGAALAHAAEHENLGAWVPERCLDKVENDRQAVAQPCRFLD